jgi:hypothetical protein
MDHSDGQFTCRCLAAAQITHFNSFDTELLVQSEHWRPEATWRDRLALCRAVVAAEGVAEEPAAQVPLDTWTASSSLPTLACFDSHYSHGSE